MSKLQLELLRSTRKSRYPRVCMRLASPSPPLKTLKGLATSISIYFKAENLLLWTRESKDTRKFILGGTQVPKTPSSSNYNTPE